jgi:NAD(P)H-flavin reductase
MTVQQTSDPMVPSPYRVERVHWETHDTYTLDLVAESGAAMHFEPGQFTMLSAPGVGEVPISISGDPAFPEVLTHTIRSVGSVTAALGSVDPGTRLGVRGPFGTPWPLPAAEGRDVLVVAGGIGLAPLRPIVYSLLSDRASYGRDVAVLYGARTPDDLLYLEELGTWRARLDTEVEVTVDRADASWRGDVGVVTNLITWLRFNPLRAIAMVCGPDIMMRFVADELQARGMTADRIYVSLERNMKCGIGLCGHCQFSSRFVCRDGPVVAWDRVVGLLSMREV